MVARNAGSTIELALASLLGQTLVDWECIVVDDASTDCTAAILEAYTDSRLRILMLKRQRGRAGARNEALALVRGSFVATLDADDFLYPDSLSRQVHCLEADPGLGACTGSLMLMSFSLTAVGRRRTQLSPGVYELAPPLTTRLPLGSTMVRTSLVGDLRFDDALKRTEDRDFFDRVLQGALVCVLHEQTYAYRWSLEIEPVLEGLRNREILYFKRMKVNPLRAGLQLVFTRAKLFLYPWLDRFGCWRLLNSWRAIPPTQDEQARFCHALEAARERSRGKKVPRRGR